MDNLIFKQSIDKSKLYGIGCPLFYRFKQDGIDYKAAAKLMYSLGAKSWRAWIHATDILKDPSTPNEENVALMKDILAEVQKYGIDVIGMSHDWFVADNMPPCSVPRRNMSNGSAYMKLLNDFEKTWETLASIFPEVDNWEIGNEWNHDPFLHPLEYDGTKNTAKFSYPEKADIATDLFYYASRGIHRANPKARTISGGFAPVNEKGEIVNAGIKEFLKLLYENIKSGKWPSNEPDDYFQAHAWHPYTWEEEPGEKWVEDNDDIYSVIAENETSMKKVIFTEYGLSEKGEPEKEKVFGEYLKKAYKLAEKHMPYLETIHYFRLFEDRKAVGERQTIDWGGPMEVYYGMFTEPDYGFSPKNKAIKYQEAAGGRGNLREFEDK